MVNNYDIIKDWINFDESDNMFMHAQIVQRSKDHPGEKVKEGAIHTYFVRSKEHLSRLMPEIELLCNFYGARAYINLQPKDFEAVNKEIMFQLALNTNLGNTVNPRKTLNSAAGKVKSRTIRWILDVDDPQDLDPVVNWVKEYMKSTKGSCDDSDIIIVPTVSGYHVIPNGYKINIEEFHKVFPDIMVHKNSMGTLLYSPEFTTPTHKDLLQVW